MAEKLSTTKINSITIPDTLQRVLPRIISGPVSPQNKNALDWGWQGFLAYGSQANVVVIDPTTLQCVQTLSSHKTHVTKVKWRRTQHYHQLSAPYTLVLASADLNGTILVWNAVFGELVATLQDGNRPISDIEWLGGVDGSEYLLAALHPPYSLVLWDTRHSTKIWKKSYTENIFSISFNPFHCNKMAFLCNGCILFTEDFNISKCPSTNGKKYNFSSPYPSPIRSTSIHGNLYRQTYLQTGPTRSSSMYGGFDEKELSNNLRRIARELIPADIKPKNDESNHQTGEIIELSFHKSIADELFVVYAREILIFDLRVNQTVGSIVLEKGFSPFVKLLSCWQRDVLYCLHESGTVSVFVRVAHPHTPSFMDSPSKDVISNDYIEVTYERCCASEPLRLNKNNRPFALALNPVSEKQLAILLGDGRVVFLDLHSKFKQMSQNKQKLTFDLEKRDSDSDGFEFDDGDGTGLEKLVTTELDSESLNSSLISSGSDHDSVNLKITDNHFKKDNKLKTMSTIIPRFPLLSLSQLLPPICEYGHFIKEKQKTNGLKLITMGLTSSLFSPPFIIRMCPPLTTRNMHIYVPLMAIGCQSGVVQVVNLATGMIEREFHLHTYPIKCIEWTSLTSFLSLSIQTLTNSQGRVRNEVIHTDIRTGFSIPLRANKTEESAIESIKVSYLKQYFVIIFKSDPFELWDCHTLSILRKMPRKFPKACCLEWSQTNPARNHRNSTSSEIKISDCDSGSSSSTKESTSCSSFVDIGEKITKENLIFASTNGSLYKLWIEGNVIKDCNKSPPDPQLTTITSMVRKNSEIVYGDSDGVFAVSDLKEKSKHVNTHRGAILKMRFGPGKDNMKLLILFNDGIDIWDVKTLVLVSQLRLQKFGVKIIDIDWASSDRPVLATVDGCLRVMDLHLNVDSSPVCQYFTKEPIVSPYLVKSEAALNLRTLLIHQPWKRRYSLRFKEEDGFDCFQIKDIKTWMSRLPYDVSNYLNCCDSVAKRALVTSYLFGDESEIKFWSIALNYLEIYRGINGKNEKSAGNLLSESGYLSGNVSKSLNVSRNISRKSLNISKNLSKSKILTENTTESKNLSECKDLSGNVPELYEKNVPKKCLSGDLSAQVSPLQSDIEYLSEGECSRSKLESASSYLGTDLHKSTDFEMKSESRKSNRFSNCEFEKGSKILDSNNSALGTSFLHALENSVYKRLERNRLLLYETRELSGKLRIFLARKLAVIGERDRVVKLLLDADPSSSMRRDGSQGTENNSYSDFYCDCLRACLVAATHHSNQAASTIKLVATNLIAAGNIWEGIELLCIIGKATDACRYLQSYGLWDDSIWLSKCVLDDIECKDIGKKWANHLFNSGQKDLGIRALLSLGSFASALESLVRCHHHQRAALLLEACKQYQAFSDHSTAESAEDTNQSPLMSVLHSLPQNIYRKYVLYLFGFGNKKAVKYFCGLMGDVGKNLLLELESL